MKRHLMRSAAFGLMLCGGLLLLDIGRGLQLHAATPTAPPLRGAGYFRADPGVIPAGGCTRLEWSFPAAAQVILSGSNWPEGTREAVNNVGTAQVCPSAAARYVPDEPVIYVLSIRYANGGQETRRVTITYEGVPTPTPTDSLLPAPSPAGPGAISTATPAMIGTLEAQPSTASTPTPLPGIARFQPFERGFIVQRAGESCVFVYATHARDGNPDGNIVIPRSIAAKPYGMYSYCTPFDGLPETSPGVTAPAGLLVPMGIFGQVWSYYEDIRAVLGYATKPEWFYLWEVPPQPPTLGGGPFSSPVVRLPDGRVLYCGYRAASAGHCHIQADSGATPVPIR